MATCRHCGYESEGLETCPLCSTVVNKEDGGDGLLGRVNRPRWEDATQSFPQNLIDTWRRSVLEPGRFFKGVPHEEAVGRPILYYLIISVISGFFLLWWDAVSSAAQLPTPISWSRYIGADQLLPLSSGTSASALLSFFLIPFVSIIGLVLWSGLLHLIVFMFRPKRRGFSATLRALSYAAGPSLLAVVPIIGSLIGGLWSLILTVIGIREAHRMSTRNAVATVLLAMIVPVLFSIGAILLIVAAIASAVA